MFFEGTSLWADLRQAQEEEGCAIRGCSMWSCQSVSLCRANTNLAVFSVGCTRQQPFVQMPTDFVAGMTKGSGTGQGGGMTAVPSCTSQQTSRRG